MKSFPVDPVFSSWVNFIKTATTFKELKGHQFFSLKFESFKTKSEFVYDYLHSLLISNLRLALLIFTFYEILSIFFVQSFQFARKLLVLFSKISIGRLAIPRLHNPLVSFYITLLPTAFERVCARII